MRVSTSLMHSQGVSAMLDRQSDLLRTQLQLATGRKILNPSDDPAGATRILNLTQALEVTQQHNANANIARQRLNLEEGALVGVGNAIQRVRELAVQGNNDSQTSETRISIAAELRERLQEMISLANTQDANGEYIFSGWQGNAQAFAQNPDGTFFYGGDDGQRFLQIGPDRQVAIGDNGNDVFRFIKNGNGTFQTQDNAANAGSGVMDTGTVVDPSLWDGDTYTISFVTNSSGNVGYNVFGAAAGQVIPPLPLDSTLDAPDYQEDAIITFAGIQTSFKGNPDPGDSFTVSPSVNQDLFTAVQDLIDAFESGATQPADHAALHNAVNRALTDMDQGLGNLLNIRAEVGGRLNSIDDQADLNESFTLNLESTISEIQDLDYAEAVSRLNLQQVGLEAAQKAFLRVQNLSLFNFL